MCKKILIAALAVGLGLAVIRGTWFGSHMRSQVREAFQKVKHSVPPEQEIARLRMEVKNLEGDDDKFIDKVARMDLAVTALSREVAKNKADLQKSEARLAKLHEEFNGGKTFVMLGEQKYTKNDLRVEALAFKTAEENLKSKEASLEAQRKHLSLERNKLMKLRTIRQEMATELQKLETALAEERQSQAASESTIDDASYRRLRKEMDAVQGRIDLLKKKREIRGEITISNRQKQVDERDTKADKYLTERFGGKAKEAAGDDNP